MDAGEEEDEAPQRRSCTPQEPGECSSNPEEEEEDEESGSDDEDDDEEGEGSSDGGESAEDGASSSEDSEGSDGEDAGEEEDEIRGVRKRRVTELEDSEESDASDSSGNENVDRCPICLMRFGHQQVGTPESCDHSFCLDCIQEWSKNVNTCPVDRQVFTLILVRLHIDGKVTRKIPVQTRQQVEEDEAGEEDITFCEVCGQSNREDRLLLCDGCDMGYHLECLDPPLDTVPVEEWFCPDCRVENDLPMAEEVGIREYELAALWEEGVGDLPPRRPRAATRLVPRTRQSERVRGVIRRNRQETVPDDQPSTSGVESLSDNSRALDLASSILAPRVPKARTAVKKRRKRRVRRRIKGTNGIVRKRKAKATGSSKTSKAGKLKTGKTTRRRKVFRRKRKSKKCTEFGQSSCFRNPALAFHAVPLRPPLLPLPPPAFRPPYALSNPSCSRNYNPFCSRQPQAIQPCSSSSRPPARLPSFKPSLLSQLRKKPQKAKGTRCRRVVRTLLPQSVKSRLAKELGMRQPPPGHTLPIVRSNAQPKTLNHMRYDVGIPTLHLFGSRDDLPTFSDGFEEGGGGGTLVMQPRAAALPSRSRLKTISSSAVLSHHPIARRKGPQVPPPAPPAFDVLGSILNGQSLLQNISHHVSIQRDGSLHVRTRPGNDAVAVHQRPAGPEANNNSAVKESSGGNTTGSSAPSSGSSGGSGHSGAAWSNTADAHDSSRSYSEFYRDSGGFADEGDADGHATVVNSKAKKSEKIEKEKKATAAADSEDIDIYSDIEMGSDYEQPVGVGGGDSFASHMGLPPEDGMNHSDISSEDDLVIDESVKEDDGEREKDGRVQPKAPEPPPTENNEDNGNGNNDDDDTQSDNSTDLVIDESRPPPAPLLPPPIPPAFLLLARTANFEPPPLPPSVLYTPEHPSQASTPSPTPSSPPPSPTPLLPSPQPANDTDTSQSNDADLPPVDHMDIPLPPTPPSNCMAAIPLPPMPPRNDVDVTASDDADTNEERHARSPSAAKSPRSQSQSPPSSEKAAASDDENDDGGDENEDDDDDEEEEDEEQRALTPSDSAKAGAWENMSDVSEGEKSLVDEGDDNECSSEVRSRPATPSVSLPSAADGEKEESQPDEDSEEDEESAVAAVVRKVTAAVAMDEEADIEREIAKACGEPHSDTEAATSPRTKRPSSPSEDRPPSPDTTDGTNEIIVLDVRTAPRRGSPGDVHSKENRRHGDPRRRHRQRHRLEGKSGEAVPIVDLTLMEEGEIDSEEQDSRRRRKKESTSSQSHRSSSRRSPHSNRRTRTEGDKEEGEIVDESPPRSARGKDSSRSHVPSRAESPPDYDQPRVNMSAMPRIPRIKRDNKIVVSGRDASDAPRSSSDKRSGVLSRIDSANMSEISWKKLSKSNRERNYRDGKPKDEQKYFRERELKQKEEEKWRREKEKQAAEQERKRAAEWAREKEARNKELQRNKERLEREKERERERERQERERREREKEKEKEKRLAEKRHREKLHRKKNKEKERRKHRSRSKEKHVSTAEKTKRKPRSRDRSDKKERKERKDKSRSADRQHREEKHREHKRKVEKVLLGSRECSPVESKEVYTSGDSIIVNVSFNRRDGKVREEKVSTRTPKRPAPLHEPARESKKQRNSEPEIVWKEKPREAPPRPPSPKTVIKSHHRSISSPEPPPPVSRESKHKGESMKRKELAEPEPLPRPPPKWKPICVEEEEEEDVEPETTAVSGDDEVEVEDVSNDASNDMPASEKSFKSGNDSDSDIVVLPPTSVVEGVSVSQEAESESDRPPSSVDIDVTAVDGSPRLGSPPVPKVSDEEEECGALSDADSHVGNESPRSPPSPNDDSAYDPFEPTKSPSPPQSPPSPVADAAPSDASRSPSPVSELPEPPPLPEVTQLPPLPPEPEPEDRPVVSDSMVATMREALAATVRVAIASTPSPTKTTVNRPSPVKTSPVKTVAPPQPPPTLPPAPPQVSTPQSAPPPVTQLPNVRLPPPNFLPPPQVAPNGTANLTLPPQMRPVSWALTNAPPMLYTTAQPTILRGGFLPQPTGQQSLPMTQLGNLLHTQAQLAMLTGLRPPMNLPPPSMNCPPPSMGHSVSSMTTTSMPMATHNGDARRNIVPTQQPLSTQAPHQDMTEVIDMEVDSPYSPGSSLEMLESSPEKRPTLQAATAMSAPMMNSQLVQATPNRARDRFDLLLGNARQNVMTVATAVALAQAKSAVDKAASHRFKLPTPVRGHPAGGRVADSRKRPAAEAVVSSSSSKKHIVRFETSGRRGTQKKDGSHKKEVTVKMDETQLKIMDELPSSAVEMQVKEKFLKKLNRQERVVEEVKLATKPFYNRREITKEEYKEILRKSVPKICHNKSGEINPVKIRALVDGYVRKLKHQRKKDTRVIHGNKKS